jgi:hypothetical protein
VEEMEDKKEKWEKEEGRETSFNIVISTSPF